MVSEGVEFASHNDAGLEDSGYDVGGSNAGSVCVFARARLSLSDSLSLSLTLSR